MATHTEQITRSEPVEQYLALYEFFKQRMNGNTRLPFYQVREKAIEQFARIGFPTTRHEEWKYTNLAPFLRHRFQLVESAPRLSEAQLQPHLWGEVSRNRIVFVNGHYSPALSRWTMPEGVHLCTLAEAFDRYPELLNEHLGKYASAEDSPFPALNTAFAQNGLFLWVKEGVQVHDPLHVLYLSTAEGGEFAVHPRNLILIEPNAHMKIFESYVGQNPQAYFQNVVNEIVIGHHGWLEWIKLQDEDRSAFHFSWTQVVQEGDSYLSSVNLDFGGRLTRNNLNVRLNGEGCESHLWGVYLADGPSLVDNHTFIDHAMPNCFSNELYKGILGGKSRGVFNGKIMVRRGAQKTNALQSNKTLLLTNDAEIDAKPQLEIFADDVKCTHGATIGQLDEDAYFYLRARGLGADTARALLRYAFLADVLENVSLEDLRQRLDQLLLERLKTMKEE